MKTYILMEMIDQYSGSLTLGVYSSLEKYYEARKKHTENHESHDNMWGLVVELDKEPEILEYYPDNIVDGRPIVS